MRRVVDWLIARAQRHPYFHLTRPNGEVYMHQWWLFGHGTNRDRSPDGQMCNPMVGRLSRWLARHLVARVHLIMLSDKDLDLHDHPAWNISVVLRGGYWELVPDAIGSRYPFYTLLESDPRNPSAEDMRINERCIARWRAPGAVVVRLACTRHKIVIPAGSEAWSLFVLGRKSRERGFYVGGGRVHWRLYESQHGKRVEQWRRT